MQYNQDQMNAIVKATTNKLTLVTGGAGVGKTTVISAIADQLDCPVLCAPTGKAAARMREATGRASQTIHRLLGYNGDYFMVPSLEGAEIIVDEASMVDSLLMAEVMKRNPARVILVGDNAQLHPVGLGAPFHDLIKLKPELVAQLNICYRSQAAVHSAGHNIRAGEDPGTLSESEGEKFSFMQAASPEDVQARIIAMLPEIDFEQDIIICPKNGKLNNATGEYQPATVNSLNQVIMNLVNPRSDADQAFNVKFKVDDRVICTKNFADMDIWNGSTGTVTAVDSKGCIWVRPDVPVESGLDEVLFTKEMMKHTKLAYVLTIHKAQGSQYRKVIVVCLNRDHIMLNRSLIYTAVTRTKQECIVIGHRSAFIRGIQRVVDRVTVMQEIAREVLGDG